jgi:DNA mismatch endonuclease (patch repair protein)
MDRSANMRAIRSKGMRPELEVRHLVHNMGYRYRLHLKGLPGKPDLVFASRNKAIFVHGCFWHMHEDCRVAHVPKSNLEYWGPKLERNRARDLKNVQSLMGDGWKVLVVWECETRSHEELKKKLQDFLQ